MKNSNAQIKTRKTFSDYLTSTGANRLKKLLFTTMISLLSFTMWAQTNLLNISTPAGWTPVGTPLASISNSTFYGHTNWVRINSPQNNTTYRFKKEFYICKEGKYRITLRGMADNRLIVRIDNDPTPVMDHHITQASQFDRPPTKHIERDFACGLHTIYVEVVNDLLSSGFYFDALISGTDGKLSNDKCACAVKVKVCNCPPDWYSNNDKSTLGGIVDGPGPQKCKKLICKPIGISPLPPNGTQLTGNIGFTWGDELWFYGTEENGGWPECTEKWVDTGVQGKTFKPGQGRSTDRR